MSAIVSAIQPGIRSIIGSALTLQSIDLTPEQAIMAIFAGGAKGAWYERSNAAARFQDHLGVTAAAVAGNLVGLGLSRDQGLALGAELVPASYTGAMTGSWVVSANSVTRNGTTNTNASVNIGATSASKRYRLRFDVANLSGDTFTVSLGGTNVGQITSNGAKSFITTGAGSGMAFIPWNGTAGQLTVTNISIQELKGNHQAQSNASLKPTYQAEPSRFVFDGIDDVLNTTFASALGATCTVGRAIPGTGAVINAGVNIGTSFVDNVTASALLIIDRALTVGETAALTSWLNQQVAL